jgi:hypothetical protein
MNELELNHQIIYYPEFNKAGVIMNLNRFGYTQFVKTTLIQKLPLYKKICDDINSGKHPDPTELTEFAFENLVDSIKIIICFENFFKGFLLLKGFIIHRLDNNIFKDLAKQQKNRPILLSEVLAQKNWGVNERLDLIDSRIGREVRGIGKNTIGMNEIFSARYIRAMDVSQDIVELCKNYIDHRNKLHYYIGESLSIGKSSYKDLIKLIDFVNDNVVVLHNSIVSEQKDQSYMISKITYDSFI